jgi:tRNA(Ile)-lysidine synthase
MTATGARSPAAPELPEALVARFGEALERLWPEGGRLGLAVSGGPDSLAMLVLAEAAIPGQFEVAAVDHGLRPESAGECAAVAALCVGRGIDCTVLAVTVASGNLQAKARAARYAALGEWAERRGFSAIATAHHADDQAETLLMRLNRGSGLAGLTGVRETRFMPGSSVSLIRPLLSFRRHELADLVAAAGIEPVHDPSNLDERFARARIRRALAELDWIDPVALARSASLLGEAQQAIEATAEEEWANGVAAEGEGFNYYPSCASSYIETEVVATIIARMGGIVSRSEVARLIQRLHGGGAGSLGGVLARATTEMSEGGAAAVVKWGFTPEPPRRLH